MNPHKKEIQTIVKCTWHTLNLKGFMNATTLEIEMNGQNDL